MKPNGIAGKRRTLGLTQEQVAKELKISLTSYRNKESGRSKFTDDQKVVLARVLEFNYQQVNDFLFNGKLPI